MMANLAKRQRVAETRISSLYPTPMPDASDPVLRIVNFMAEEAVIGAVFQRPDLYPALSEILQPADFYVIAHGFMWHAFDQLSGRGDGIDLVTVYGELERMNCPLIREGNVMERMATLIQNAPDADNAERYARDIFETALRIRVMRSALKMVETALDKSISTDDLIDTCDKELYIATNRQIENATDAKSIVGAYYDRMELAVGGRKPGVLSGFRLLDEIIPSGFTPGEVTVLAGSEGMGKTTLLLSIIRNILQRGEPVTLFSLEMKQHEIVHNLMAMETGIYKSDLKTFTLTPGQLTQFTKAAGDMAKWPLDVVDEYPSLTPVQLRRKLRKMVLSRQPGLLVIDGLWLMEASESVKDRPRDVFFIMRDLNVIARDFNVPILISHQYNAEVNKSARPTIYHLSESAGVRRNAQVVYGMHRESYYNPTEAKDLATWLHVLKDRNGRASGQKVPFVYSDNYSRYEGGVNVSIEL